MIKKIILSTMILLYSISMAWGDQISIDSFVTGGDVTISHLETFRTKVINAINNADGENIQAATIPHTALDANADPVNRWNEAFNDFVYTGLLAPTSTSLTSTTTLGTAFIFGQRVVKAATAKTYTASKDTYVDLSSTGTYTYTEVAVGASAPSVASNSLRLFKARSDGTTITTVEDLRVLGITLATEDFALRGFNLTVITTDDTVSVDNGVVYNGTIRIAKTAVTGLHLDTATDWWDGVVDTYSTPDWCYVGVDNSGNIEFLGNNPGNRADTSGNTAGRQLYYYDSTKYWRLLGAISVDGSNNIATTYRSYNGEVIFSTQKIEVNGATSQSWVTTEMTNVPATARIAKLIVQQTGTGADSARIREGAATNDNGFEIATTSAVTTGGVFTEARVNSSQQIDYRQTSATGVTYIWSVGYKDDLR